MSWIGNPVFGRYLISVVAGLMLAAAFPLPGIASLAWIAPGMLIMVAAGVSGSQAFRLGYAGGLTYCLASLYWLLHNPFLSGAIAGWLALSAYLALYPACWVWLGWKLLPGKHEPTGASGSSVSWSKHMMSAGLYTRVVWGIACAVLWVALEMVRARLLTGFPWNLLGSSQCQMLPIIQIASVTGVYGISFIIVWFSVSLACATAAIIQRPAKRWDWLIEMAMPLAVLMGVVWFGTVKMARLPSGGPSLKTTLIQPSFPQTLIWDETENTNRFKQLIELSERALEQTKPDLLVWPESAAPGLLRYDPDFAYPIITNLIGANDVWLILASDDAEPRVPSDNPADFDFFNSSFLLNPSGELMATYRKQHLVVFGEYIPLERWLPFMKWFTPVESSLSPGTRPVSFSMAQLGATVSVLICFEDVFPHLARHYVNDDTDFLLNLTNDGWFGQSAAQWQHAANAVFRAVENRVPLVRSANNGLTCWVDAAGRMHEVYYPGTKDVYCAGFKTARIPLLGPGQHRELTLYRRYGDWFGWLCTGLAVCLVVPAILLRKPLKAGISESANRD